MEPLAAVADLWLERQPQPVTVGQRTPQGPSDQEPIPRPLVHLAAGEAIVVATGSFCSMNGMLGGGEQAVGIDAVLRGAARADARCEAELVAGHHQRGGDRVAQQFWVPQRAVMAQSGADDA